MGNTAGNKNVKPSLPAGLHHHIPSKGALPQEAPTFYKSIRTTPLQVNVPDALGDAVKDRIADPELRKLLSAIGEACVDIANSLRTGAKGWESELIGGQNTFGDKQLAVDVASDDAVFERLKRSGVCAMASSEETPEEVRISEGGKFSVAFDPLDGSSIVDANFAVGSIFGVWQGEGFTGRTGREQKAALMAQYGPKLTMALAYQTSAGGKACCEVAYSPKEGWSVQKDFSIQPKLGKVFAPGNLKITNSYPAYQNLVQHWITNGFRLRYTGGMVPDVYHMLSKGKGVFTNCALSDKKAKLRLLFECAPIAFIVEAAGGRSLVDPAMIPGAGSQSVLDYPVKRLDQRVGICYGGVEDVALFQKFMCQSSKL